MDQGEYGGIRPDAQGQGEHGRCSEARSLAQLPQREAAVLQEC